MDFCYTCVLLWTELATSRWHAVEMMCLARGVYFCGIYSAINNFSFLKIVICHQIAPIKNWRCIKKTPNRDHFSFLNLVIFDQVAPIKNWRCNPLIFTFYQILKINGLWMRTDFYVLRTDFRNSLLFDLLFSSLLTFILFYSIFSSISSILSSLLDVL